MLLSGGLDRGGNTRPQNPQQPRSFADLQKYGMARPAKPSFRSIGRLPGVPTSPTMDPAPYNRPDVNVQPPAPYSQPGMPAQTPAPPSGLGGALHDRVLGALNQPSRYDKDVAKSTYDMFSNRLDEEYRINRDRDDEEFARRGLYFSGPAAGRYGDRAVQHERTKQDLASNLLDRQAGTYQSDLLNSIQSAMGYGQQQFDNQLTTAQFNNMLDQQNIMNILAALGYT